MHTPTDETTVLRQQVAELREEAAILRLARDGDRDEAFSRLLSKCDRQRRALNDMNRRNASLRFALRLVNRLGRGLSRDEYVTARDAEQNEQLKSRLLDTLDETQAVPA
jgi:hypothetical protein